MELSLTKEKEIKKFFVIFYIIGAIGMAIPFTSPLFKKLIPYSLLLCFFYLAYFHPNKKDKKSWLVFSFIFISGFLVEMLGVNTGKIFGSYLYGDSLGFKILETPLMIGLNWLFLVYTSAALVEKLRLTKWIKIFLASTCMLAYDLVLEQLAPTMDMWSWQNNVVPLQNYISWFLLAFIFHSLLVVFKIKTTNPLSVLLFCAQFLFFIFLLFFAV